MPDDQRQHLAEQQAALVESLVAGTPPPADFDRAQVTTAADALLRKRTRGIEKAAPWLIALVSERYAPLLDEYLRENPSPPAEGQAVDVQRFIRFLIHSDLPCCQRAKLLLHTLRRFVRRR